MRVLVCDPAYPLEEVRARLAAAEAGSVGQAGAGVVALLVSPEAPVRTADLERMPDLRVIATASTGTDHVDVDAAAARGVRVRNVAGYCTEEVSDHALALLVAARRGLVEHDRSVRAGAWDWLAAGLPKRLAGTRVGVVGWGRIGRRLGEKAQALGMEVRWWDPLLAGGEADLDALLRWADAVSLHAPLTPASRGLLDARRLGLMREGAILVNTARGGLVDRAALLDARHVRALLDTVWEQPPRAELVAAPHIAMTPYIAWLSPETETLPYVLAAEAVADELAR